MRNKKTTQNLAFITRFPYRETDNTPDSIPKEITEWFGFEEALKII